MITVPRELAVDAILDMGSVTPLVMSYFSVIFLFIALFFFIRNVFEIFSYVKSAQQTSLIRDLNDNK